MPLEELLVALGGSDMSEGSLVLRFIAFDNVDVEGMLVSAVGGSSI